MPGNELQQQAFFERARADAGRIEPLHDAQRFFGNRQLLGAMRLQVAVELRRQRRQQLFERRLQVAVGVEAVDDPLGHPPHGIVELEPAQLMMQVIDQRLGPGQHVGHRIVAAIAFLLDAIHRRPATLLVVVRQILGHVDEPLEVVLVVAVVFDDQLALGVGDAAGAASSSAGCFRLVSSTSTWSSTGLSSISCSMRSCNAISGSCRISIDWIIRGASTCF